MQSTDDFATLRVRLIERLTDSPVPAKKTMGTLQTLREDGTWPDIDLLNRNGDAWEPTVHLERMRELGILFRTSGGDPKIAKAVKRALTAWVKQDPTSENWWYNHVGSPKEVAIVLLLMSDSFSPDEVPGSLAIVYRARVEMGRIWECLIRLMGAVLASNEDEAEVAISAIWSGIAVETSIHGGEGIQHDGSYHLHGPQLYSGGYGHVHAVNMALVMAVTAGTRFAVPAERLELFSRFILDGSQWMIRGGAFEVTARGRVTSRPEGDIRPEFAQICRDMLVSGAQRRVELEEFLGRLERNQSSPSSLEGVRHFWKSDILVRQSERYYGSVKMNSVRTCGTESGNGEGLTNYAILFGCNLVMRRGDEYRNIFPSWDWRRLPGGTCSATDKPWPLLPFGEGAMGTTSFVGGVTDGDAGLAAWILDRDGISARKSCVLLERGIFAAGTAINGPEDEILQSGVNQCWMAGDVWVKDAVGIRQVGEEGARGAIEWVWHDGTGYVFAEGQDVVVGRKSQDGDWSRIMDCSDALEYGNTLPRDMLDRPVFSIWITHGRNVRGGWYQYSISPGVELESMPSIVSGERVSILANTCEAQVFFDSAAGLTFGTFYSAGSAAGVTVDRPCLVIIREGLEGSSVTISNPENEPATVTVTIEGTRENTISLPNGPMAGASVRSKHR